MRIENALNRLFGRERLTVKFETLRLMAQDYAGRHREPPPLPAKIDTMANACQIHLPVRRPLDGPGDFSNAWYGYAKHIRADLVKDPWIKLEQETKRSQRWAAWDVQTCSLN